MGEGQGAHPEHKVAVASFWIQRTEVTNRMYDFCVDLGACAPPLDAQAAENLGVDQLLDRPVVHVNWEQARTYCNWINGRLPTEAEWEKTSRGPNGNPYPWGAAPPTCELLNFDECLRRPSHVTTHAPGQSFYAALDMAGNVYEWVADWYSDDYYARSPQNDPRGPESAEMRGVRGGSFESVEEDVLAFQRYSLPPFEHRADLGFRCVIPDPRPFPPFCQTSARVMGDQGGARCELQVAIKGQGCGFVTADLVGAEIQSFEAEAPLTCQLVNQTRVYCSGPQAYGGRIEICGQCPGASSAPLEAQCPAGYLPSGDQVGICQYGGQPADGTGNCPSGFRRAAADPQRCEMVVEQFGACPLDYVLDASSSQCRQAQLAGGAWDCGVGQYFDQGAGACVSSPLARPGCMAGFTLHRNLQCCQALQESTYPECRPGEVWSDFSGCIPAPGEGSARNCATAFVDTGYCPQGGGGSGGGSSGTGSCFPQLCKPPRFWDPLNCCCSHPNKGCE